MGGDLHYTGPRALEREEGAAVAGIVTQRRGGADDPGVGARLYGWLQLLTGLFVLGLLFLLVFRGFAERSMQTLKARPGLSVALGLLAFIGIPVVIGLVFFLGAFVGGAWLGIFGLALFGIALSLCFPLIAAFLALQLVTRIKRGPTASWWPMLLGLVVLTALLFIPVLGPLVAFATVLFGLGAIVLTMIPTLRFTSTPTAATAPLPPTPAEASTAFRE